MYDLTFSQRMFLKKPKVMFSNQIYVTVKNMTNVNLNRRYHAKATKLLQYFAGVFLFLDIFSNLIEAKKTIQNKNLTLLVFLTIENQIFTLTSIFLKICLSWMETWLYNRGVIVRFLTPLLCNSTCAMYNFIWHSVNFSDFWKW